MKKLLIISASPVAEGNDDTLAHLSAEVCREAGADVETVFLRDYTIGLCRACYACADTGVCVQKDGFQDLLARMHQADGIIVTAPIYYNLPAAQILVPLNRLCCTFACKSYVVGPKKKIALMFTCTGSDPAEMKHIADLVLNLPSIHRSVEAYRTEVFTSCLQHDTCRKNEAYQERVRELALWTVKE